MAAMFIVTRPDFDVAAALATGRRITGIPTPGDHENTLLWPERIAGAFVQYWRDPVEWGGRRSPERMGTYELSRTM